jgi:hypothetical protein
MLKISTKKFDPANLPEGVWVTYSEGVRFKVRKLTSDSTRAIRKPFVRLELELNPSSRRLEHVEKVDNDGLDDALAEYLIEAFEGIGDDNGILPNTPESRKAILNQPSLREFIWEASQSLEIVSQEKREDDLKN